MDKKCRGTACIINVLTFENNIMKCRTGTNMDRDRLTQLFEQLHFRVVVFNDEDGLSAAVGYIMLIMFFIVLNLLFARICFLYPCCCKRSSEKTVNNYCKLSCSNNEFSSCW